MKYYGWIAICCLLSNLTALSQNQTLFNKADSLFHEKEYLQASELASTLKSRLLEAGKIDSAAILSYRELYYFSKLRDFEKSKEMFSDRVPLLIELNADSFWIAKHLLKLASINRRLGERVLMLDNYERAISIYEKLNSNHSNVALAYREAATEYLKKLEYEKSINYLNKAILSDTSNYYKGNIHSLLAQNYSYLRDEKKLLRHLKTARNIKRLSAQDQAILDDLTSGFYFEKGQLDSSLFFANSAMQYFENNPNNQTWKTYYGMAKQYQALSNHVLIETYFKKAFKSQNQYYSKKDREVSRLNVAFGDYLKETGQLDSALVYYQRAVIQVFPGFNDLNIFVNPSLKEAHAESWAMTSLARKAKALRMIYSKNGELQYLKAASDTYKLSLACIQKIKETYDSEEAKLLMSDYSSNYYEQAIEVNSLLYNKTKKPSYIENVFALMEASKAYVLAQAVQRNKGVILSDIPDSLIQQEILFRSKIAQERSDILELRLLETEKDDKSLDKARIRLGDLQKDYKTFLDHLKTEFPKFEALTAKANLPSVKEIQNETLSAGDLLIEYFQGDSSLYAVAISKHKSYLFSIPRQKSNLSTIAKFLGFFLNNSSINSDPQAFFSTASNLYQNLFPELLTDEMESKGNLTIIPDGDLNFIPFDALITKEYNERNYANAPFLIQKKNINLAWSVALLRNYYGSNGNSKNFYHMSPIFKDGQRNLAPLLNGNMETEGICGFNSLQEAEASKESLKTILQDCSLLHLSTHASAGEEQQTPKIEFFDASLVLSELYALSMNTELVVLSGCETNLGKVEKGEGVMSLARGFTYAGSKSLIASLWQVNEQSTASLFSSFYANIKNGASKSKALSKAKKAYLLSEIPNVQKSPYYWAGFAFYGLDGNMNIPNCNYWGYWTLLIACFTFLLFTIFKMLQGRIKRGPGA